MVEESTPLPERSPELSALFAAYETETARSPAQVEAALEVVSAKAVAVGATTSSVGLSAALKLTIAAVAIAVGGAAIWGLAGSDERAAAPLVAMESPDVDPTAESPDVEPAAEAPRTVETPLVVATPPVETSSEATASPTPTPTSPRPRKPKRPVAKSSDAGGSASLAAELELLNKARAALRAGNGQRALDLVRKHRKAHTKSTFAEERDATEVMALCELGRNEDAKRSAGRYRKAFPGSSRDVLAACE